MTLEERRMGLLQSTGDARPADRPGEAADAAAAHPHLMANGSTTGTALSVDSGAVLV